MTALLIAVGIARGGPARYRDSGPPGLAFAWGTRLVELTSRLVIGRAAGGSVGEARLSAAPFVPRVVRMGLGRGDTTLPAFSLRRVPMLEASDVGRTSLNMAASASACRAATLAGEASAATLARGELARSASWT